MPMPAFLDRKMKHFFTLMDRDGSGTLELNDYLTTADSVSSAFGMAAGSAEHNELRRAFTRFWEDIVKPMDTNGNGHVNFDEYLTAYNAGVRDDAQGYKRIRPISDAILNIADTESNGSARPVQGPCAADDEGAGRRVGGRHVRDHPVCGAITHPRRLTWSPMLSARVSTSAVPADGPVVRLVDPVGSRESAMGAPAHPE
jgi:hypothetical protein